MVARIRKALAALKPTIVVHVHVHQHGLSNGGSSGATWTSPMGGGGSGPTGPTLVSGSGSGAGGSYGFRRPA